MTILSRLLVLPVVVAASLGVTVAAAGPGLADPAPNAAQSWVGIWRNTNNTVHIRAVPCGGGSMCGTVVWANEQTKADVASRGRNIVGMQLFNGFRQTGPMEWKGSVYVPTMDRNFSGKITLSDHNNLVSVGCMLAGLFCQTRHWSRIS